MATVGCSEHAIVQDHEVINDKDLVLVPGQCEGSVPQNKEQEIDRFPVSVNHQELSSHSQYAPIYRLRIRKYHQPHQMSEMS